MKVSLFIVLGCIGGLASLVTWLVRRRQLRPVTAQPSGNTPPSNPQPDTAVRYRMLSEMTSDYLYSARILADGQVEHEWMSDSFLHITGYTPAELGLSGLWTQLIHPEDVAIVEAATNMLLAGNAYSEAFQIITKHGATRFLREHARPEFDETGRVIRVYGAAKDVTAQHLAEEALRTSERNLRLIAENTTDCVFSYDMQRRLTYVNSAFELVTGYSLSDLYQQQFIDYVHPNDNARMRALFNAAFAGHAFDDVEHRIVTKQGEIRWFSSSCGPLLDDDGTQIGIQGRERDISTRRRAESERRAVELKLQETQKLESLGVLAGGIAHDFNNLLQAIYGNASLALLELTPRDGLYEPLIQIEHSSQRAAELVQQLLAYAGKGNVIMQAVDLNQIVREMAELLRSSIPPTITLAYELSPGLPPIMADITQMRQIALNLITNAAEAIGDRHGTIRLTSELRQLSQRDLASAVVGADLVPGAYIVVQIADTGSGIDAATRTRIFDPFFTTRFTGRGLGLAAVLGIMRANAGGLIVESQVDVGTQFTLIFPPTTLPAPPAKVPAHLWHDVGRVLVIDDEESVRNVTQRGLERLGFQAISAADGLTGIALFQQYKQEIVCVLLDLVLPGVGGEQIARQLIALDPSVRIVVMSGYTHSQIRERLGDIGLSGTLEKPFTADDLSDALHQAISPGVEL